MGDGVFVKVGVLVNVGVYVVVGVSDAVGVEEGVLVNVGVQVDVSVKVGVLVIVGVLEGVGVAVFGRPPADGYNCDEGITSQLRLPERVCHESTAVASAPVSRKSIWISYFCPRTRLMDGPNLVGND